MRPAQPRAFTAHVLALLLAWGSLACATNPATGERQLSLIGTEREIEMGRQADGDITQAMGLYEDEQLQSYVDRLGQEMAALSERPDLPWTFRIVDEPGVNAFALPGGFIYVTRGILAHFDSEAQLAAVLGHEIGHVTGRHSVNQMSRQQLAALGLGVGSILSEEVARFQGLISAGLQLAFLSFSRDHEREADDLGLRYMSAAGWDPGEMPEVFAMLSRAGGGQDAQRVPEWLSTHPDPENREDRIEQRIAEQNLGAGTGTVNRASYLRRLEGLVFGDDPRNGYFRDGTFLHPELRFRIEFPAGWQKVNQARQVVAQPESGEAIAGLSLAEGEEADAALRAFLSQEGLRTVATETRSVSGLPAAWARFTASVQQGTLSGIVAFVEYDGRVYQVMGYTSEARFDQYRDAFGRVLSSFAPLDDPALLDVEPKRIEIVELPESMTLAEFHDRYPSTVDLDRLSVLNQVDTDAALEGGRLVKRVVGEGAPESTAGSDGR